jgi:hypothetical protein
LSSTGWDDKKSADAIVIIGNEPQIEIVEASSASWRKGLNFKTLLILDGCTLLKPMQAHRKRNKGNNFFFKNVKQWN